MNARAWSKLLATFSPDSDQAALEYEKIRLKLIRFFEWKNFLNPEELTDLAINRVARRLDEGLTLEGDDPGGYFYRVATLIAKEMFRKNARQDRVMEAHGRELRPASESPVPDRRLLCLRECVGKLPPGQRSLIMDYHGVDAKDRIAQRRKLASQLEIPVNALRIRAHRIRLTLEGCVHECDRRQQATAWPPGRGHNRDTGKSPRREGP